MSKHTPAPWDTTDGRHIFKDDRQQVCCGNGYGNECCGNADIDGEFLHIATCEDEANANLIAAAPELLENLVELVEWMESVTFGKAPQQLVNKARAAIAKAKVEA